MSSVAVIGGGPAGLAAAELMAEAGLSVTVYEAKPTVARKFLMAGKSGLNLTKAEDVEAMLPHYTEAAPWLAPALHAWDADAIVAWAEGLDQEMFTGSTGRVFPRAMKASPLLRAWLARLDALGVTIRTRHRWTGWEGSVPRITGPDGASVTVDANATLLACGGASWARLGSDGAWSDWIGLDTAPFAASNAAISVPWSPHMDKHMGHPIKGVAWRAGPYRSRGEAVASKRGLEGGGIYSISRGVREGHELYIDLLPDLSVDDVANRLARPRGKASFANHLRKTLKLTPLKIALAQEWGRPWPDDALRIARRLKKLRVAHDGLRPMDEAISTAGGVAATALDDALMLRAKPGVFCAGEMLDWEAPTGGYLLTACLATGRWAGQGVVRYLNG
ncbi:TIGR03862 family flavoprotein [Tateyamaria sp. ANG-S1]|uniref:TIGR03862 family flavoprotein n=1 Tax=Tateyamaria sp. ANG-S1 TaxID=1577905 RepID=UPI00057D2072|nr:TIGR03862 family flavoprotein [Tateyamaria sp. ANG-S1]KIC49919.1 NAD(FAD)-utilizing dehydrogenase [Tateyamaria sp. ANG-S1]